MREFAYTVPDKVLALIPEDIIDLLGGLPMVVIRNIDLLETFAGVARISRWGSLFGLGVAALDVNYNARLDITTREGLAIWVAMLLRVRCGGLMTSGVQCSSWVWISRSSTKRSRDNIYGNIGKNSVRLANTMNEHQAPYIYTYYIYTYMHRNKDNRKFRNQVSDYSQCP